MDNSRVTYRFIKPNIVEARIDDCELDAFCIVNTKLCSHATCSLTIMPHRADERFVMPSTFVAHAECSDEDQFNWELGKCIALDRLTDKYTRSLNKHINNIIRFIHKGLSED